MHFTVGCYQAADGDSFEPSVVGTHLHCPKVILNVALFTTCFKKHEFKAKANKCFVSICQPFPFHRISFGRSLSFQPGLIPRGTPASRILYGQIAVGRMDCEGRICIAECHADPQDGGTKDSSRQSSKQASGLPDKETFDMQVRTPFPCLHVGSMDDH